MSEKTTSKTQSVKLPMDVVESARIVAGYTGDQISELLGDILRPVLAKRERDLIAKRQRQLDN